jgi:hypothetical protein
VAGIKFMRAALPVFAAFLLVSPAFIASASADDHWHGDIHRFHEYDYDRWRHGSWVEGDHGGRHGWWWTVEGEWYYYPAPVYPFPDPYTPPTVVVESTPQATVVTTAPTYYYCGTPRGYYPYVAQCYGPWQKVVGGAVIAIQPPGEIGAPPVPPEPGQTADSEDYANDADQLRMFTTEFRDVDLNDKYARAALKNLRAEVETFRQSLYQRSYNAMQLLKQSETLEHDIDAQTKKLPPR